jgi:Protein of unknown function (DUF3574)
MRKAAPQILAAAIGGGLATAGLVAATSFATPDTTDTTTQPAATQGGLPPGKVFKRTELYFGSEKPDGSEVTDEQFDAFVDSTVTPRFPDGLTQLTGEGQFLGSTGPIEEKSFVVILLYPYDDRQANREIEQIRTAYKRLFKQESVLRADSQDRVSF